MIIYWKLIFIIVRIRTKSVEKSRGDLHGLLTNFSKFPDQQTDHQTNCGGWDVTISFENLI